MANYSYHPIPWHGSPHDYTGDYILGYATEETTQRYIPGTRFTTWDGRVFKYGRSITALTSAWGAFNNSGVVNIAVDSTNNLVKGSRELTFALGNDDGYGGGGVAEDELIGGYIVSGHGEEKCQSRCIMGNTAAAVSTAITVTVDNPWSNACADTTPWTEVILNPYRYLDCSTYGEAGCGALCGCMGVAAEGVGALTYTWIQSYGPCYCVGTGTTSADNYQRSIWMGDNGSVTDGSECTIETGWQLVGWTIDESSSGTMPYVMLQISI